jgi:hypothetical protein
MFRLLAATRGFHLSLRIGTPRTKNTLFVKQAGMSVGKGTLRKAIAEGVVVPEYDIQPKKVHCRVLPQDPAGSLRSCKSWELQS